MAFIQLYPYAEPETGMLDAPAVYPFRGPGFGIVYVNKAGKRFVNEMERRDVRFPRRTRHRNETDFLHLQ